MKKYIISLFILLLLIISIVLNHNPDVIYACGLFAFIGNEPDKFFNSMSFNVLGIFNDTRGGDGCGFVTPGCLTKVTGTRYNTKYKDSIVDKKIIVPAQIEDHILGHTRKASIGGVEDKYTQPFYIEKNHPLSIARIGKNKEYRTYVKSIPKHAVVFAGTHNGTITNSSELATKYGIISKFKNDTQILYEILFKGQYDVLKDYEGAAALIFHDYFERKTYVFKGESPNYTGYDYMLEERPLFMWKVAENNHYFSSMKDSLLFIGGDDDSITEVPSNKLLVFQDGKIINTIDIERKTSSQKGAYVPIITNNYPVANRNHSSSRDFSGRDLFDDITHDEDSFNSAYDIYNKHSVDDVFGEKRNKHKKAFSFPRSETDVRVLANSSKTFLYSTSDVLNWNNEHLANPYSARKVIYNKGRYWINKSLMHGVYPISNYGCIPETRTGFLQSYSKSKLYFFIEGIMVEDALAYAICMTQYETLYDNSLRILIDTGQKIDPVDILGFDDDLLEEIGAFSIYPVNPLFSYDISECIRYFDEKSKSHNKFNYYTGNLNALFSLRTYQVNNGDLVSIRNNFESQDPPHVYEDNEIAEHYIKGTNLDAIYNDKHAETQYDTIGRLLVTGVVPNESAPCSVLTKVLRGEYEIRDSVVNTGVAIAQAAFNRTFIRSKDCLVCSASGLELDTTCMYCVGAVIANNFKTV